MCAPGALRETMNILLCSVPYRPSVGGIETVSALLADQFHRAGHEVTLVTQTAAEGRDPEPFTLLRQPSAAQLTRAVRQCDVVLHNNISLRLAWPLLAWRRPWVVAHHTWIPRQGPGAKAGWLKRQAMALGTQIAVSDAVAQDLGMPSQVIPNPYDPALFRCLPGVERSRELAFVGRLVSDKGLNLLIQALVLMRQQGKAPRVSIIGSGPDEALLQQRVRELGLTAQVRFAGRLVGPALVRALNAHRAVVVPSVWEEPFGLVALEAQACGCVPVVARSGGLPQAAGPAGVLFRKGDPVALADTLAQVVSTATSRGIGDDPQVQAHLQRHRPDRVAAAYLEVLEHAQRAAGPLARAA